MSDDGFRLDLGPDFVPPAWVSTACRQAQHGACDNALGACDCGCHAGEREATA